MVPWLPFIKVGTFKVAMLKFKAETTWKHVCIVLHLELHYAEVYRQTS
jgi:hypothetical protein